MFTLLQHSLFQFYLRAYLTPCTKPFEIVPENVTPCKENIAFQEHKTTFVLTCKCINTRRGGCPDAWGRLRVPFSPSSRLLISAASGGTGLLVAPQNPSSAQGLPGAMNQARLLLRTRTWPQHPGVGGEPGQPHTSQENCGRAEPSVRQHRSPFRCPAPAGTLKGTED